MTHLEALTALRGKLAGDVLLPGDDDYDTASTVYSAKGAPAVVVRPRSADDVAEAVRYAASESLVLSVKSGGHSGLGHSTNDGGLVIDLSSLNSVEVLEGNRVRIGGGAVWGDIANALKPHHLALTSGDTVSVGVGGLTLGGGVGWMVRQYGLALDNLIEAEVVTATGDTLTANATEHPDLFWALRGGGGNFGVVTSFTFQAHPLRGVVAGTIRFGLDDLAGLLAGWRDVMRTAPDELNSTFVAMPAFGPEMPAGAMVAVCFAGDDEAAAMAAIEPLLHLPDQLGHDIRPKAYADVLEEAHPPAGPMTVVDYNAFARDFSDELIGLLVAAYGEMGASVLMIRSLLGALNRVPVDATAFAHRDSEVLIISAAFLGPDAGPDAIQGVRDLWTPMGGHLHGTYGNFRSSADEAIIAAMYPPLTRERLVEVKRRYDPDNLFNRNQNIAP